MLLVQKNNDISQLGLENLEMVGWKFRKEADLAVSGTERLNLNWRRNFIKLRVWTWIEYRKILLPDADTTVWGDISLRSDGFGMILSRFVTPTDAVDFGAIPDTWVDRMPADNFNAAVMLRPSFEAFFGFSISPISPHAL